MNRSAVHTSMKPGPYNKQTHKQTQALLLTNLSSFHAHLYRSLLPPPPQAAWMSVARGDTVTMLLRGRVSQALALKGALEPATALPLLPGSWNF